MLRLALALALGAACGSDAAKKSQEPAPATPARVAPPSPAARAPTPEPPAPEPVAAPREPAGAPLQTRSRDEIARCKGSLAAGSRRCTAIVASGDPLQPGAAAAELESATHCFADRAQACACACDRAGAGADNCNYMTPIDTTDGLAIAICAD